jgi:hypothetical protein
MHAYVNEEEESLLMNGEEYRCGVCRGHVLAVRGRRDSDL